MSEVPGRLPGPDGFRCARCGQGAAFELPQRKLWQCKACGRQTSLTAGSVLHRTRLPLTVWFWATYLVTTHTPGLSAVQLQRQLGLSYETAWALLHQLRRAMGNPEREALQDQVKVDIRAKRGLVIEVTPPTSWC